MADEIKPKLLVCEDDKYYSHTLKMKFDSLGYDTLIAENGTQLFQMLPTFAPDLILLDLVMPVMSGFEVLEKLKAEGKLGSVKIVVLSNLGQEEDVEKAKALGVTDYVIKSNASIHEVIDMVGRYIGKR